ncbi:MAG: hypothetical protein EOO48_12650 [Flavobacterium sp.]|nr:MAG: hypothetical protein EOO48_12650 [Flavobacterium sp.]
MTESQEAAIEELQTANEELLSGSEELQTLNEELETSTEELQSNNEELISVNDELIDRQQQLTAARNYAEAIVSTIREPLVVLDARLHIKSANTAFYKFFTCSESETGGMSFFDLGNKDWNKAELKKMFEDMLPKHTVIENYRAMLDSSRIGRREILLNATQIINDKHSEPLILVALTEAKQTISKDFVTPA